MNDGRDTGREEEHEVYQRLAQHDADTARWSDEIPIQDAPAKPCPLCGESYCGGRCDRDEEVPWLIQRIREQAGDDWDPEPIGCDVCGLPTCRGCHPAPATWGEIE